MKYLLLMALLYSNLSFSKFPTSKELRQKYPNIDETSTRKENKKILCPFWRLIEKTGSLDILDTNSTSDIVLKISDLVKKAKEFGCGIIECGSVANLVSVGQLSYLNVTKPFSVNITALHKARGISHECGLTFEKGGSKVSNIQRNKTLRRLEKLSIKNTPKGVLYEDDLMSIKKKICKEQGVSITTAGIVEVGLIFSFLGGKDRGFIEYADVHRFFHAKMPITKSIDKI